MSTCIGYLCSSMSWGGLEMNQLRNARWMHERGHRVLFLCVENSPSDKKAGEWNLPVLHIRKHKKYYDFAAARELRKLLEVQHVSHLIIRDTRDMSIAATVRHRMGKRLHLSYFMEMQLGVKKKHLLHRIRQRYIDVWSCPLHWLRDQVKTMTAYRNEVVIIPSGLELEPFRKAPDRKESRELLQLPQDLFLFGLIGRFDPQKGQQLAINALQRIDDTSSGLVFLGEPTVGEGAAYYASIETSIREHGLENRVFIRPFRSDTAVFYSAIDWMIMATKAESIGMVTMEALACGTPVLGSDRGGTPELLAQGAGGRLFISQSEEDLARQMEHILRERPAYEKEKLQELVAASDHRLVCEMVEQALDIPHRASQSL